TKNIIAIAAGISDGLGFGDNTKASLMTRGLAEMTRLGTALGAKAPTFSGLAGMGDLIVTCISPHSRNRAVGERLGQGLDLDAIMEDSPMVAEGVLNSKAFHELARERNVKVPITDNVYEVLYRGKDPTESVRELMTREATEEIQEATLLPPDRTV
ncbi:MAG: NAD(P)H-dependent glycerol-3-phosphate dehydrogenase, partial [Terriglobia bacterium]